MYFGFFPDHTEESNNPHAPRKCGAGRNTQMKQLQLGIKYCLPLSAEEYLWHWGSGVRLYSKHLEKSETICNQKFYLASVTHSFAF